MPSLLILWLRAALHCVYWVSFSWRVNLLLGGKNYGMGLAGLRNDKARSVRQLEVDRGLDCWLDWSLHLSTFLHSRLDNEDKGVGASLFFSSNACLRRRIALSRSSDAFLFLSANLCRFVLSVSFKICLHDTLTILKVRKANFLNYNHVSSG